MSTNTHPRIAAAAAVAEFGQPSARTGGRNPKWPYVPILVHTHADGSRGYTQQIKGLAFATRAEAIDAAASYVERLRASLAVHLAQPGYRALREQYGLPRELENL